MELIFTIDDLVVFMVNSCSSFSNFSSHERFDQLFIHFIYWKLNNILRAINNLFFIINCGRCGVGGTLDVGDISAKLTMIHPVFKPQTSLAHIAGIFITNIFQRERKRKGERVMMMTRETRSQQQACTTLVYPVLAIHDGAHVGAPFVGGATSVALEGARPPQIFQFV